MEAETVVDAMKRFEDGWEDDYQVGMQEQRFVGFVVALSFHPQPPLPRFCSM